MESSQLGYTLTGEPAYLASYNEGLTHVDRDFGRLRENVGGSRDLETAADRLIQAKNAWLAHANGTVSLRQKGKTPDTDWNKLGRTLRDDLNQRLAAIVQDQIKVRDSRMRAVTRVKHIFVGSCCVIAILLALSVGQLVRRQFQVLALNHRHALHTAHLRNAALARSETELEQQKEWFRVTLTSIGDGVIVTDKEGRVVFMNHEAEKLTGWPSVEALLSPLGVVFRLVHEETREKDRRLGQRGFPHEQGGRGGQAGRAPQPHGRGVADR